MMAAQVLPQRTGMGALWQGSKNPRAWNLRTLASTAASQKSVVRSRVSPQALSKSPSLLCLNQPQPTSLSILTHINCMSKLGGKCCFHFWKTNFDIVGMKYKRWCSLYLELQRSSAFSASKIRKEKIVSLPFSMCLKRNYNFSQLKTSIVKIKNKVKCSNWYN